MYVSLAESSKFCLCQAELIQPIFHLEFLFSCKVLTAISVFLRYGPQKIPKIWEIASYVVFSCTQYEYCRYENLLLRF